MKKIVLFDTAIGSLNKGDNIIMESTKRNIKELLEKNFVLSLPTHTPVVHFYQQINKYRTFDFARTADLKFICGSNILNNKMIHPWPNWNINIFNVKAHKNAILVGVGSNHFKDNKVKLYSKILYRSFLSREYIHSTRDEKAKLILEKMGFKAINTGCPTTWSLNEKFCREIPRTKKDKVIFTLTDYRADRENDQQLIDTLIKNYKEVFFWPQGSGDYKYFNSFNGINSINVISPDLESFSDVLKSGVDYIGTRLHGGIYAMQHKVRAIIIIVDERAREMNKCYNLNCIERDQISNLGEIINSELSTSVSINHENIESWLAQFK